MHFMLFDDISDYKLLSDLLSLTSGKYFSNNTMYLPNQSDSELSVDFINVVKVRSLERTSGSEAK